MTKQAKKPLQTIKNGPLADNNYSMLYMYIYLFI